MDQVPSVPKMLANQVMEPMNRGSENIVGSATEVITKGSGGVGEIKKTITSSADDVSISKCALSCACCSGLAMCVLCIPCMVLGMVVNCLLLPVNAAIDCCCPSQPPLSFPVIDKSMFDWHFRYLLHMSTPLHCLFGFIRFGSVRFDSAFDYLDQGSFDFLCVL